jgi:hypothetical protein
MTRAEPIEKWQASRHAERGGCQEHFIEPCHLLDEPKPNIDPTDTEYAFERSRASHDLRHPPL